MADSLQDQLRKAGLVSDKQAKKAARVKHAADMERKAHGAQSDDPAVVAQRARTDKARKDKELNEARDREAAAKALAAQIRQLIALNAQARDGADVAFNFADGRAIRKLLVTKRQQDALADGRLAVVRLDERYELVPATIAEKIRERDANTVVLRNDPSNRPAAEPDDPYAKYTIPDDLDW
jgi:uncharacterized protein YaiL (DUF2058 family)